MPSNESWNVTGRTGFEDLKQSPDPLPPLGDKDVLIKFHGASLTYRDLVMTKGLYPFSQSDNIVPGSDGAGEVKSVGKNVRRFKSGKSGDESHHTVQSRTYSRLSG